MRSGEVKAKHRSLRCPRDRTCDGIVTEDVCFACEIIAGAAGSGCARVMTQSGAESTTACLPEVRRPPTDDLSLGGMLTNYREADGAESNH